MADLETLVRLERMEKKYRAQRTILGLVVLVGGVFALGAWKERMEVLHVRGIVVEDSLGHPRIVLGAPMAIAGYTGGTGGSGIAVLGSDGQIRAAMGSPTPEPTEDGKVVKREGGGASGFMIYDPHGNERGGISAFEDGRANVCLDYAKGVKEAACMFVFPDDQFAGLTLNGTPGFGFEQVGLIVNKLGLAQIKVSATGGQERAILKATGAGPAELVVYDSTTKKFVDVMPKTPR